MYFSDSREHGHLRELLRCPTTSQRYLRFHPAANLLDRNAESFGLCHVDGSGAFGGDAPGIQSVNEDTVRG